MSEADALQRSVLPRDGEDAAIEVLSTGPAPAFLFLHGACCQARVWEPLMLALAARGVDSAALSFRGHGGSGGAGLLQAFRIMDYMRDTDRVLDGMAAPPILVGHSMGGLVAQLVAEERALPGLALLASSPVGGMQRDGARMLLRQPRAFFRAIRRQSFRALYEEEGATRWLLFGPDAADALVRRFMAEAVEESWLAGSEMTKWLPAPERVRCPVLVVGGEEDHMVSPASVRRTAEAYGVAPVMLPRRGHMLPVECEAAALAGLLLEFRNRLGGAACATAS